MSKYANTEYRILDNIENKNDNNSLNDYHRISNNECNIVLKLTFCSCGMFLDMLVYLLMVDIDADVMNMFTRDCGLTAEELTRVTDSTCSVHSV